MSGDIEWQKIRHVFEAVVGLEASQRAAYLETHCEPTLRAEVEALLRADQTGAEFLETPPWLADGIIPDHIGRYRIIRSIGEGATSSVYLAETDGTNAYVAIKVFRRYLSGAGNSRRFHIERQILSSLNHPNISRLLDGGITEDGARYFVLEYVAGDPITEYCEHWRLSVHERLELFCTVCTAVHYAHQNLVVHRDLKPSNILTTHDGLPKLLDFGIAKLLDPWSNPDLYNQTATGVRPMTPQYASPEQISGGPITTASDIYSLGVVLYELLTGKLPCELGARDKQGHEAPGLEDEPPLPSKVSATFRRRIGGDLDRIVLMALRREPQRRYASALEFCEDIRRYCTGMPVRAHKSSFQYRTGKFLLRHRAVVASGVAVLGMIVAFAVAMSIEARHTELERNQAQLERDNAITVARFLQDIFRLSDPGMSRGETITAREILDIGVERIGRDLQGREEIQAALKHTTGVVYRNLGLYDRAEPLLESAVHLSESTRVQNNSRLVEYLGSLADLRAAQGNFVEAEALLQKALAMLLAADEETSLRTANTLMVLGAVLRDTGDYGGAESLLLRALEIRRSILGRRHEQVAESLGELALTRMRTGELDSAEQGFREALKIALEMFGDNHPLVFMELDYLAELLIIRGDLAEAEMMYQALLEIGSRIYAPDHPDYIDAVNDYGVVLGLMGELDRAEPLLRDALARRIEIFGERHPSVAESMINVGMLLREQGQMEEAEKLFLDGLSVLQDVHGLEHPHTAIALNNLGTLYANTSRLEQAEQALRRALSIRLASLGKMHADVGVSHYRLASVLVQMGKVEEAEPLLRESIMILSGTLPAGHWRIGEAEIELGVCLALMQQFDEATPLLASGLTALRIALGDRHRRVLEAEARIAEVDGLSET